ncbi:hypothetical protein FACS189476_11660 [Spirochaetia bacterium]|nr:hypothetical protein FACS189476_11660 [Spirochaetia bacterium]
MNEVSVKVEIDPLLQKRLETIAQAERRTLLDQIAYLLEKGLMISENQIARYKPDAKEISPISGTSPGGGKIKA